MSEPPRTSPGSRKRQVVTIAAWAALLAASFAAVELATGDIHFGKEADPLANHAAYVQSRAEAKRCRAEPFTLNENHTTTTRRIYSCVDAAGRWACFIEQGEIANVTYIVRVLFEHEPRRARPRCTLPN